MNFFTAMCDFQYMAVNRNDDNTYTDLYDKIVVDNLVSYKEYTSRDVPLFIPPLMFSRVDKPCDVSCVYKTEYFHRNPDYKNPDKGRPQNYIGTGELTCSAQLHDIVISKKIIKLDRTLRVFLCLYFSIHTHMYTSQQEFR